MLLTSAIALVLASEVPTPRPPAPLPAPAPPPLTVVIPPQWKRIPTLTELTPFYPPRAAARDVEGRAVLFCTVSLRGRLENCVVESETPPDLGFGQAALAMAPLFELFPGVRDGKPVADRPVRAPIAFKLPGGPMPGLEGTLRCYGLLSAHLALAPTDSRLAEGVALARERAAFLWSGQQAPGDIEARLADSVRSTPAPARPGATRDPCFAQFLY